MKYNKWRVGDNQGNQVMFRFANRKLAVIRIQHWIAMGIRSDSLLLTFPSVALSGCK